MSAAENQAVFLSYASQDAEAVQRIAEALRAAGVEVWFDRNELVGGDAWDQKIRRQIKECALFLPIISASTQARTEGYFRLEWRLADQRTHLMAKGRPFLLPVVIDATRDAEAHVPESFTEVQWTHLPGGEAPEKFCARVKQLLEGRTVLQAAPDAPPRGWKHHATPAASRRVPAGVWTGVLLAAIALGGFFALRPKPEAGAGSRAPAAEKSGPLTEAQQLVAKARRILDDGDEMNREVYALAEELLKKAEALDASEASAWALHATLSAKRYGMGLDRSAVRLEALRMQSERALRLAPESKEAQFANVRALFSLNQELPEVERKLLDLAARHPEDVQIVRELARVYMRQDKTDLALATQQRALQLAPDDPALKAEIMNILILSGRWTEAQAVMARLLQGRTSARLLAYEIYLALNWSGDLEGAMKAIQAWPSWFMLEDRGAGHAALVAWWKGDSAKALEIATRFPRDYLRDYLFSGPRAVLTAFAHEQAGHLESARADWRLALQVAERELALAPDDVWSLHWKAWAQARLGDTAAAASLLRQLEERNVPLLGLPQIAGGLGGLAMAVGRPDDALVQIQRVRPGARSMVREITRTNLRLNPLFEPVRADPRFQALIAAAPGPEEKKETKLPAAAPATAGKSLVVLPLENLSPDPENAFFTEGMHAQIITTLQRMTDLRVFGRDTALAFKRGSMTVTEFAQRLGATNVLTGSVRRAGAKARILLELRQASDDALLWASPDAERDLTDTWAVQGEVAEQVARALKARESVGSNAHARYLTRNPQAFDLFVKADQRFFAGDFEAAIALYSAAHELDRTYVVPAYMLVNVHCNLAYLRTEPAERVAWAEGARRWLEVVARLDPNSFGVIAESHYASSVEGDHLRALELAEKGLRALPNEGAAPTFHAVALQGLGRVAEAFESFHRATQLDPLLMFSLLNEARALASLRREPEAMAMDARIAALTGGNGPFDRVAHVRAQLAHRLRGTLPGAIESIGSPLERAFWSWRARRFEVAEQAAAEAVSANQSGDAVRFELRVLQHDALQRLGQSARAEGLARELGEIAQRFQTVPDVGPSRRAGWLAQAEARLGHPDAAIVAVRRFVEDASPDRQRMLRWQREIVAAELYAYLNRPRECVELLAKLLRVPCGLTVPLLAADPAWDNVREDAAFKALLADPKNSAPL